MQAYRPKGPFSIQLIKDCPEAPTSSPVTFVLQWLLSSSSIDGGRLHSRETPPPPWTAAPTVKGNVREWCLRTQLLWTLDLTS